MTRNLAGKRVLVLGGSGMVGRAISSELSGSGALPVVVANSQTDGFPIGIKLRRGDLRSPSVCAELMRDADFVVMAAASTGGMLQNASAPWMQVNDNILLNLNVLEAAAVQEKKLLLIGSATLYQEKSGLIAESDLDLNLDPPGLHFGIGWVSRYVEKLAQFWHVKKGLRCALVRAANVFGPFAKFNPANSNFIPAIIRKVEEADACLQVLGSPMVERDVIFSKDFARACVKLLAALGDGFDVFNLGTGSSVTVDAVVRSLVEISGKSHLDVRYEGSGVPAVRGRILNCEKIKKHLQWEPEWTLYGSLSETYEWWRQNKTFWKR
jgi:nucleoside-diphosphate-sugar epimerase